MPKALADVKVLDFSWVVAAPFCSKVLAEHGATVVRVESMRRLDLARAYVPYANGVGIDHCSFFAAYNNDKYGIQLNLDHPKSRSVVERLVRWADIALENFTPQTMERWGLGYENLCHWNSSLIMLRSSLFGQHGPCANQPGFGTMMQAQAGFTTLVGWPDRPPVGTQVPYTDFIAPWYTVCLILAALDYRRLTGEGQCIDLSQMETGLHFMAPALLDASANQRALRSNGNRHRAASPHAVFRCQGEDRWCAIAVFDDEQWHGLRRAMSEPAWCQEERFATLSGRKQHEDELESLVQQWTSRLLPETVMERLQQHGVPSGVVANGQDLHEDPQLAYRKHFVRLQHPEMGETAYESPSFRLSGATGEPSRCAPCLGEHTEYVCQEILGIPDDEFVQLLGEGVFE